ncbi:VCBS repeat-containing protein [Akkermansiaceae bacterium]|nr:VCBS repeat-containing protein [Akkermansiaceae bacterium]MDA7912865.1 VCBS repeat-containing protein [bacterium]MDA7537372.1 VCBS repeat-containing protein [Akkermansiaceae bacterium]MDA9197270.1 VCBS repeat-containing protein [Akkermansiaceae bacterium]MDB4469911.1 VCBS repeat-containing protein [Akkermansiaceae bacterium]
MIGSLLFLGCSEKDEGPKLDVELVDSRETSTTQEAEVWSTGVKEQLAELADTLLEPTGPINRASLAKSITTIDFQTKHQKERDAGSSILVRELSYSFSKTPMELGDFFKEMRTTLFFEGESDESHLKFKVYRVEGDAGTLKTRQLLTASGYREGKNIRSQAVIDAVWTLPTDHDLPELLSFAMPNLIQSEFREKETEGFDDIAPIILGRNDSWGQQLKHGMNHWVRQIDEAIKPDFLGYHGVALGDVDGDGLEDLHLCQPGGLPNLLFRQEEDGTMTDISAVAGIDWLDNSTAALLVDLDNDGDKDLAVATRAAFLILENDGAARFTLRSKFKGIESGYSPTASDYDLDGDLDLLILRYNANSREVGDFPTPHPFHNARNGGANVLLKNEGQLRFSDVTQESGLGKENFRFSFAAAWEDYDNDGDSDLYIANDFGPNQLLRNDGGKFIDTSVESLSQDWGFGMSVSWGDLDRDGNMDLYVSSMFSGAGNLVIPQDDFNPSMPKQTRQRYLKMVRGNSLMRNNGSGRFTDITSPMDEGYAGWAWGTGLGDFNNDGWEDIYVANGYISQPKKDDL